MLFNRQKILLGLLAEFGGVLTNTDLQKYLFLLSLGQLEKAYHFVPYKYGCFSLQATQDKRKLTEKGYLEPNVDWRLTKDVDIQDMLTLDELRPIWKIKKEFHSLKGDNLVGYVYRKYPYYAIKSTIASRVLSKEEMREVEKHKPRKRGFALCSIGYEGRSIEEYLNLLIRNDIKVLCDVRKNPISRKYGFSKTTLMNALQNVGIEYVHCPQLGIDSKSREALHSQEDYDTLFEEYEGTVLKNSHKEVIELYELLKKVKRIAVTCYEKLPRQCHRTRVANAVLRLGGKDIKLIEV